MGGKDAQDILKYTMLVGVKDGLVMIKEGLIEISTGIYLSITPLSQVITDQ